MNNEMKLIAKELAKMGRDGDTILAHITPQEARVLRAMGGAGTTNPYTGLPEFKKIKLKNIVKAVAKVAAVVVAVAAPAVLPAIGSAILGAGASTVAATAAGAAVVNGAATLIATGDLEKAAKSAAVAAVSVGVGGNVSGAVNNALVNSGVPAAAASAAANMTGAAAGAVATGRNPAEAIAGAATNIAVNIGVNVARDVALGPGQPPAPVESRDVAAAPPSTADIIARTAEEIRGSTPLPPSATVAAGPSTTVTDVTAPTTGVPPGYYRDFDGSIKPISRIDITGLPPETPPEVPTGTPPPPAAVDRPFTYTPPANVFLPPPTSRVTLPSPVAGPISREPVITTPPAGQPPANLPPVSITEPIRGVPIDGVPGAGVPIGGGAGGAPSPGTGGGGDGIGVPGTGGAGDGSAVARDITPPSTVTPEPGAEPVIPGEDVAAGPPDETGRGRIGIKLPAKKKGKDSVLRSTRLFEPVSVVSAVAPIERGRKELEDEESLDEPVGKWGSQTLRGLLGI